jgi:23S rRNA (adenine2030-N6)-methyltransferase
VQDRAVLVELQPPEASALEQGLAQVAPRAKMRVDRGDGYERLRAFLPPAERRGLTFMDPPYEESAQDFVRLSASIAEALKRFAGGCIAVWYPIKDERTVTAWLAPLARSLKVETLAAEIWLYPRDSRVALNGSGLLIINPPYLLEERMQVWLPELHGLLSTAPGSGCSVRKPG